MSKAPRRIKLFANVLNIGNQMGGWRHPGAFAGGLHVLDFYREVAALAEGAKFDALFFADGPGFRRVQGRDAFSRMDVGKVEPITLLSALAAVTSHIGLVATASTSFNEPYNIARKFASLDHLSGGRAGWNAVTSTGENEAHNFGLTSHLDHATRYERAEEFVDVTRALWDSWEDDAFLLDKESGRWFDPDKLHALAHKGRFFSVEGPLNVGRSPQGHPLLVQAGGSGPGRDLGARTADAIFTNSQPLELAQQFYADMKARVAGFGRDPDHLKILPGIQPVIAETPAKAREKEEFLKSLVHPDLALSWLEMWLGGVDLSGHDLDGPLPEIPETNANRSVRDQLLAFAARGRFSIRDLATHVAATRGGVSMVGTPEQVADELERRFTQGAADGFVVSSAYLPGSLRDFIDHVVPILQKRGLFRQEYEGTTLRENLGLPRPANRYVGRPDLHVEPEIWAKAPAGGLVTV